ncbi:uncharacterized protein LOC129611156 [Condylostylus longicornis]|uniref:uncharacterized protein LOC129611156 n=1 Tax=Condylostylus longicornis TaxID=2530218 RepID=UPI00244DAE16|nr:uncharacterized protein LOC129611156 [Condylostylus longicornis]
MIGIGVSLLVISGAIWRLSIPDEIENCPCFRHLETCRNCNSPYCGNRLLQTYNGYMYPEFQHRPPPPSYMTSLNECTVGLLFHHEVANLQRNDSIRISTPPPAYRSSQSLSVFVPLHATLSPSQHSLIQEVTTIPLTSSTTFTESERSQLILSQTDTIINNNDVINNSQVLPKVMSTVHENSSTPSHKKDGVTQLSETI